MSPSVPVSILQFEDQLKMAEREHSAFFAAAETLFGPEQAKLSAEDWLNATEHVLGSNSRLAVTGAITIVASSRLAHRLAVAR
jgi:hypothetical protein